MPQLLTFHAKSMWWDVNAHLIFFNFQYVFHKNTKNSIFVHTQKFPGFTKGLNNAVTVCKAQWYLVSVYISTSMLIQWFNVH